MAKWGSLGGAMRRFVVYTRYPCPPTPSQVAAGGNCVVVFTDTLGQSAGQVVNDNFESMTTTTFVSVGGCTPMSQSGSVGPVVVTVSPGTCLMGGDKVSISGSGLKIRDIGGLEEGNSAPDQPTVGVPLEGKDVPVGCSKLGDDLFAGFRNR